MDEQLTIGDELRDRGMARAVTNTDQDLVHQVDLAIIRCVQRHPLFTAETVRDEVEAAYGAAFGLGFGLDRPISKIIGARLNAQARRSIVRTTGMTTKATRPEAHSRRLLIWTRGTL